MRLADVAPHEEYLHPAHGRVLVIGAHPHDGARLIIERQETTDPDDDDLVLDTCEAGDLSPAVGSHWPYLGFTSRERSLQRSRAFGEQHGFAEVPEGSGRWQYPDGRPVSDDVWNAAWRKTYIKQEAA